jgi:hypothetical protein
MSDNDAEVSAATSAMDKYRGGDTGETGSAWSWSGLVQSGQPKKWEFATT